MTPPDDLARMGRWLDAYFAKQEFLRLSYRKSDNGDIPDEMVVGPAAARWNDPLLTEWRLLPSRVTEQQVLELERELPAPFPSLYRAYLTSRHVLNAQARLKQGTVSLPDLPSDDPLASVRELLRTWGHLLKAGYIPLGDFDSGWGPFCADALRPLGGDGVDYPICLIDHESYFELGEAAAVREKVAPIARPLWPSFSQLLGELELKAGLDVKASH
jgi:hypothetical protein